MRLLTNTACNPWRDFDRLVGSLGTIPSWVPAFDVEETDAAYILRGDIPGLAQKDIEVRIEDGVLGLVGERPATAASTGRFAPSRQERPAGKFARRFRLPDNVDADGVKAAYANGVLEFTLPKREPADVARLVPVR